jgi:hypothetical protein
MNQRFLMWGLASITFLVTLAISSWHEGLWPTVASSDRPTPGASTAFSLSDQSAKRPFRPFSPDRPAAATPVVTAVAPEPQAQQQEHEQPVTPAEAPLPEMPTATPEVDTAEFLAHRDRAAQHSSRAR